VHVVRRGSDFARPSFSDQLVSNFQLIDLRVLSHASSPSIRLSVDQSNDETEKA
jgi:hypothetical protein